MKNKHCQLAMLVFGCGRIMNLDDFGSSVNLATNLLA